MRVTDLLTLFDEQVVPKATKIHLATANGSEDPLDVYLAGKFDDWQRWQTRRNFERRFVLSLIKLPATDQWLYASIHTSPGHELRATDVYYDLQEVLSCSEFSGRLVATFTRPG